mgnify:CR=1 FL=1
MADYFETEAIQGETPFKCYVCGKVIELTNTAALSLWMYLDSERLKFLDLENSIT